MIATQMFEAFRKEVSSGRYLEKREKTIGKGSGEQKSQRISPERKVQILLNADALKKTLLLRLQSRSQSAFQRNGKARALGVTILK